MTKIWIHEVYEKAGLSQNLNAAFLQVLSNLREKNIKGSLAENAMNIEFPELKTDNLPKCLYINLQTKDKYENLFSLLLKISSYRDISPVESLSYCHFVENTHMYFGSCTQVEKELLSEYFFAFYFV